MYVITTIRQFKHRDRPKGLRPCASRSSLVYPVGSQKRTSSEGTREGLRATLSLIIRRPDEKTEWLLRTSILGDGTFADGWAHSSSQNYAMHVLGE